MKGKLSLKIAAALLLAAPAQAQEGAPAADCAALAGERATLEAEQAALQRTIGDIALGRHAKRRKKGGGAGDAARGVAGAAASVLLPFPLGLAVNAAGAAARGKGKAKAPLPPAPDAAAIVARQQAVDARLAEIAASCG